MIFAIPSRWTGRKVLVTGGLGFIGSNLVHRLVALGADIVVVDSLVPSHGGNVFNIAGIEDRIRVVVADLCDTADLADLVGGRDIIFNLAGQSAHLDSMKDPFMDLAINCTAPLRLLEACRQYNPQTKVLFASTRQLYGKPDALPVDEAHPVRPVDINGINKWAGESYHRLYNNVYGLRTVSLRLTNTYGPRMRIKDARQTFLGLWIRMALEGKPFEVWGGEQLRDFTYVDDCVEALLAAADNDTLDGGAYNLGGHGPVDLTSLARLIIAVEGRGEFTTRAFPTESKHIDIGDYHTDDSAFRQRTGWGPVIPLEEGLRRSLEYFRLHWAHYL